MNRVVDGVPKKVMHIWVSCLLIAAGILVLHALPRSYYSDPPYYQKNVDNLGSISIAQR
jgi:hypothetical protein